MAVSKLAVKSDAQQSFRAALLQLSDLSSHGIQSTVLLLVLRTGLAGGELPFAIDGAHIFFPCLPPSCRSFLFRVNTPPTGQCTPDLECQG